MNTNCLNKSLFLGVALIALSVPALAFAQTTLTTDTPAADMTMTTPTAPVIPAAPSTPTVATPAVPSTMPKAVTTSASGDPSSDPAVSAVLDRLKQDSTPLSISDMSAAQDALARLNLLGEIENKLSQIEETRQKRQYGAFTPMGAMPLPGGAAMPSAASSMPPMSQFGNPAAFQGFSGGSQNPEILSIAGSGGAYKATLKVDGRTMTAKNGTILPDGSKVTNISASGVSVNKKGKTSKLSFVHAE